MWYIYKFLDLLVSHSHMNTLIRSNRVVIDNDDELSQRREQIKNYINHMIILN